MLNWPDDYVALAQSGLIARLSDPDDSLFIWDVRFLSGESAKPGIQPLDDQLFDVAVFATTVSGDYWAYRLDALPSADVLLCYHDADDAEYVAPDIVSMLFRQTVLAAGNVELDESGSGWDLSFMKEHVKEVCSSLEDFLLPSMIAALVQIYSVKLPNARSHYTTLAAPETCDEIIRRCIDYSRTGESLDWREC